MSTDLIREVVEILEGSTNMIKATMERDRVASSHDITVTGISWNHDPECRTATLGGECVSPMTHSNV